MRVLLLAYEWPPITAAQALRWFYLANGLARRGVTVHVLCPAITSLQPYAVANHASIIEHRVWPGPFIGLAQWLAGPPRTLETEGDTAPQPVTSTLLMRAYKGMRFVLDRVLYPDVRTEWYPFAKRELKRLLRQYSFDVVISSHEPGVDLLLGLWLKRHAQLPWVVDLADPLCAPYSPRWRRWFDAWFENLVLRKADRVILTNDELRTVLTRRQAVNMSDKFVTIAQGAPDELPACPGKFRHAADRLHIVFTGNFYQDFRSPEEFAHALRTCNTDTMRVTIAGDNGRFAPLFQGIPGVELLGKIGHFDCLALQASADLLLNIGNKQDYQLPGKIFEYLVAGKAILHLRGSSTDPAVPILQGVQSTFVVDNQRASIAAALGEIVDHWKGGTLTVAPAEVERSKAMHGWSARVDVLERLLRDVAADRQDQPVS